MHRKVRDLRQAGRRDRTAFIQGMQRVMKATSAVADSSIVLSAKERGVLFFDEYQKGI